MKLKQTLALTIILLSVLGIMLDSQIILALTVVVTLLSLTYKPFREMF